MKNRHSILLLGLSLMFGIISHLGYGSGKGNICGAFFKNTEKEPLPGALVALYKADTNLLVDNTYTLDNGQFTLKAPSLKGKFYIVATKGMISQKNEFEFDPAKPAQYIAVHYHDSPNRFIKVITWIIQKFDYMITTLIGLFIGLGFKWIQENKKRKDLNNYL